ncbi:MAG: nucleotidyltransferase family protein [Acidobacteriota bacterium]
MTKTKDQRPEPAAVAAIVLAAGRSRRMGAFKPLLPFGPATIIETCLENIRNGGVETIVVVLGQEPHAEELKTQLQNAGIIFAINPDPASEMSASIACGVRALPERIQAVIINPADYAAVPGEVVSRLICEWQQGALLVKPVWNNRGGHPVLIDLEFRAQLLNLDPDGGLKRFFRKRPELVKRVSVNSNYIARDMDTWDDYVALHMEVFGVAAPELPHKSVLSKRG